MFSLDTSWILQLHRSTLILSSCIQYTRKRMERPANCPKQRWWNKNTNKSYKLGIVVSTWEYALRICTVGERYFPAILLSQNPAFSVLQAGNLKYTECCWDHTFYLHKYNVYLKFLFLCVNNFSPFYGQKYIPGRVHGMNLYSPTQMDQLSWPKEPNQPTTKHSCAKKHHFVQFGLSGAI